MNEIQLARRAPPNVTVRLRMHGAAFTARRNERGRGQLRSAVQVGAQYGARDAGDSLDSEDALCGDASDLLPSTNGGRPDAQRVSERLLAAGGLDGDLEGSHGFHGPYISTILISMQQWGLMFPMKCGLDQGLRLIWRRRHGKSKG